MITLDHPGFVVPDLDDAVSWLCKHLALTVALREDPVDVPGKRLGIDHQVVTLKGALLIDNNGSRLELHQHLAYDRKPVPVAPHVPLPRERYLPDGAPHIAFRSTDFYRDYARWTDAGVDWWDTPELITSGAYEGRIWIYCTLPFANIKTELLQNTLAA